MYLLNSHGWVKKLRVIIFCITFYTSKISITSNYQVKFYKLNSSGGLEKIAKLSIEDSYEQFNNKAPLVQIALKDSIPK